MWDGTRRMDVTLWPSIVPSPARQLSWGDWVFLSSLSLRSMHSITSKLRKRQRSRDNNFDSDSDNDTRERLISKGISEAWPRFIVVEGFTGVSPFIFQKWLEGVSSSFQDVKKQRDGSYLVKCPNQKSSRGLQGRNGSNFNAGAKEIRISVSAHRTLNSCKGVVRCGASRHLRDVLKESTDLEIKSYLEPQGVTDIRRLTAFRQGNQVNTFTFVATFALASVPKEVKIFYENVKVEPFIPSPMRCFKCQKFGHTKVRCRASNEICGKCGKTVHSAEESCVASCVNCSGKHESYSKNCPQWKLESEVQRVRVLEQLSFPDAKKKVLQNSAPFSASFAFVASAKPKTSEVSVQTSLTWVHGQMQCFTSGRQPVSTQASEAIWVDNVPLPSRDPSLSSDSSNKPLSPGKHGASSTNNQSSSMPQKKSSRPLSPKKPSVSSSVDLSSSTPSMAPETCDIIVETKPISENDQGKKKTQSKIPARPASKKYQSASRKTESVSEKQKSGRLQKGEDPLKTVNRFDGLPVEEAMMEEDEKDS